MNSVKNLVKGDNPLISSRSPIKKIIIAQEKIIRIPGYQKTELEKIIVKKSDTKIEIPPNVGIGVA